MSPDSQDSNFPTAADDAKTARLTPAITPQVASPAYRLAFDDEEFLLREEMRPVRLLLELSKPELALSEHNVRNTVVIFGSARTLSPEQAAGEMHYLEQQRVVQPDDSILERRLAQARRNLRQAENYATAQALAKYIAEQNRQTHALQLHVVTGGGPGIMEAANRGAHEAGDRSIGLNIVLPREQEPNIYITPELCFRFHYFAMRKMHFLMRARALVAFPGGFGTLDELFETLTLIQTGKIKPMPLLLFDRHYWKRLINWELMVEEGMISREDLNLFTYVDTVEEAWVHISAHLG
jgi:uncharacterized protein (TIGR00730 family)